jgi:hypothetical protein
MPTKTVGHDFGLLQALDERLAMYGWLLNTGIKLVIVVDMEGRPAEPGRLTSALGLRNSDLTPVCTRPCINLCKAKFLTSWSSFRPSKRFKRRISTSFGILSTYRTSTTRACQPRAEALRCKLKAPGLLARSSALGRPGILGSQHYDSR